MNKDKEKVAKPKKEFSKCIVIVSWVVTIVWITLSFILAFFNKDTNSDVTVALVTESFGVTLAYYIYQASLKISRNVSGVDKDGIPFKVKYKLDEVLDFEESEEQDSELEDKEVISYE